MTKSEAERQLMVKSNTNQEVDMIRIGDLRVRRDSVKSFFPLPMGGMDSQDPRIIIGMETPNYPVVIRFNSIKERDVEMKRLDDLLRVKGTK